LDRQTVWTGKLFGQANCLVLAGMLSGNVWSALRSPTSGFNDSRIGSMNLLPQPIRLLESTTPTSQLSPVLARVQSP